MKILIAGAGKLGSALSRQLATEGYDLTLIDSNSGVLESCLERYDVMTVCGNCAVKDTLIKAGVSDSDLLIAVTGSDEVNLLSCMTAHVINPNLHTIARVRNPEYNQQIFDMREYFELSMMINPDRQAAVEIGRLLKYPGFLKLDTFARGRVEIVELRIDQASKLSNLKLSEINTVIKCRILVCAVLRGGEVMTPDGNFVLRDGDRIFVTASADNLSTLLSNLGIITRKVKRAVLCGGGRASIYLTEQLKKSGMSVSIIEIDRDRSIQLASLLPDTNIIHGDATNRRLLESEGVFNTDALVALTGMDEINIIISLYATAGGVPQVVTKLGRVDDNSILDSLPIGSIVSPKQLCCNNIIRYVRAIRNQTGAAVSVHFIADGKAEAMEFRIDDTVLHCGEQLRTLKIKRNLLLACIIRGDKTEIPDGNSSFQPGDSVVVVTNGKSQIYKLNDIFE